MSWQSEWISRVQTTENETAELLAAKWDALQVRLGLVGALNRGGRLDMGDARDMVTRMAAIEEQLNRYHALLRQERGLLREEGGR